MTLWNYHPARGDIPASGITKIHDIVGDLNQSLQYRRASMLARSKGSTFEEVARKTMAATPRDQTLKI